MHEDVQVTRPQCVGVRVFGWLLPRLGIREEELHHLGATLSRGAELSPVARDLAAELRRRWNVDFDDAGAIGRRYRRQDEVGTPYSITVDFETLDDRAVTIRERDSMTQERVALDQVEAYLAARLVGC